MFNFFNILRSNYLDSLGESKPCSYVLFVCYLWCWALDDKPAEHEDISPGKEKMFPNERLLTLLLSLQTFWPIYTVYTAQNTKAGDMSTFWKIKHNFLQKVTAFISTTEVLSSTFTHLQLLSSIFIHFHQLSSTFVHLIHFHPVSSILST